MYVNVLKKLSIIVKETSNFNKGNVNYEFQLRKDFKDIKINFIILP